MTRTRAARRGQVWTFDYTVGFLLFLFALLVVLSTLVKTVLVPDDFSDVARSADAVSQRLMGAGYPPSWRSDDVISAGLLTDDGLSMRKAGYLAALAQGDYDGSKALLDTRYEYAITLQERDGSYVPIGASCFIGSPSVSAQQTPLRRPVRTAYYAYDAGGEQLLPAMEALNATVYEGDRLGALLTDRTNYDLIVMEEPRLSATTPPYDAQKAADLEDFVQRGGTLFLIGNVSLPELYGLNLTPANLSPSAAGTGVNDTFLNLSNQTISSIPATASMISFTNESRYESLVASTAEQDYAAAFTDGDGDVYYLGGLAGTINGTGEPLLNYTADRLNATSLQDSADCAAVAIPSTGVQHLVAVRRLVAYQGRILIMTVTVWENR